MTVTRSGDVSLLQDVIISGFSDGMLGLAPIAAAAGPLKDLLSEVLAKALLFKLKAAITWEVTSPSDENVQDYHMSFTPLRVSRGSEALGGGQTASIAGLLQSVRQRAQDKIEFAKMRESAITFKRIKEIRFSLIPHRRERSTRR